MLHRKNPVQLILNEFLQDSLASHLQNLQQETLLHDMDTRLLLRTLNSYMGPGNHPVYDFR